MHCETPSSEILDCQKLLDCQKYSESALMRSSSPLLWLSAFWSSSAAKSTPKVHCETPSAELLDCQKCSCAPPALLQCTAHPAAAPAPRLPKILPKCTAKLWGLKTLTAKSSWTAESTLKVRCETRHRMQKMLHCAPQMHCAFCGFLSWSTPKSTSRSALRNSRL